MSKQRLRSDISPSGGSNSVQDTEPLRVTRKAPARFWRVQPPSRAALAVASLSRDLVEQCAQTPVARTRDRLGPAKEARNHHPTRTCPQNGHLHTVFCA